MSMHILSRNTGAQSDTPFPANSNVPDIAPDGFAAISLHNKGFNPVTFLEVVHPSATPEDLRRGRDNLQRGIESRSGALLRLVDDNFDRFISIKAATATVYDEMKEGPLSTEGDYSVAELKEGIKCERARNKRQSRRHWR